MDLQFDVAHCGACDASCGAEQDCVLGACTERCEPPHIVCGDQCVDPASSSEHCGGCGKACGKEQVCTEGTCQTVCEEGLAACLGTCVDTSTDSSNCGTCGNICWEGEVCVDGTCACPEPLVECAGTCTDTSSDRLNCGGCGDACPGSLICESGACTCPEGLERCGDECIDTTADAANCGGCGEVCPARPHSTASCSAGSCQWSCELGWEDCNGDPLDGCETDTRTDTAHCGECNNDCTAPAHVEGAFCSGGFCRFECEAGWDRCGEDPLPGCQTDLSSDATHCGACSLSCEGLPQSTGGSCEDFSCTLHGCVEGWDDCDDDPTNGCEAELTVDPNNCGACGEVCDGLCIDGSCVLADFVDHAGSVACAKLTNGMVACWGSNSWGQVGLGVTGLVDTLRPTILPGLQDIETLSLGEWHACAVDKEGELYCWGDNRQGQLGDGTLIQRNTPVHIPTPHKVASVRGGPKSTCVTYVNGETWCWGENVSGQFGDGTKDDTKAPGYTPILSPRKMNVSGAGGLFLGASHSCALVGEGLLCAGSQATGKLGNNETSGEALAPTPPLNLEPVTSLPLGGVSNHTCALLSNQFVKCWGSNAYGQLGNSKGGYSEFEKLPVVVSGLTNVKQVAISDTHSCALLHDGTVRCWGSNSYAKLGLGPDSRRYDSNCQCYVYDNKNTPAQVVNLSNVKQISASKTNTCALLEDGNIMCWGYGASGRLGNGGKTESDVPVRVQWYE